MDVCVRVSVCVSVCMCLCLCGCGCDQIRSDQILAQYCVVQYEI